jgi:hypothetical protein
MITRYYVSIICFKADKSYVFEEQAESLLQAVRIILTYQAKRGYEVVQYTIDTTVVLDVFN